MVRYLRIMVTRKSHDRVEINVIPVTPNSSRTRRSKQARRVYKTDSDAHSAISGAALVVSAAVCVLLSGASVGAKATFVTFGGAGARSINATDTVTGYYCCGNSFVRTPDGTITQFAVPGAQFTEAVSINDENAIAGYYCDTSGCDGQGTIHGFARANDGTFTTFDVSGASETFPSGINNKSEIAGYYEDSTNHPHGFARTAGGKIKTFDPQGAILTVSYGINDKGVIVGTYGDANGIAHGFMRATDGSITIIDGPQSEGTFATAINIKGVITGWYGQTDGAQHGFLRTPDGTMTSFEEPDRYVEPMSINRKDEITGLSQSREKPSHYLGFLRRTDGTIKEFRVPNGGRTVPWGINDSGVIAGTYEVGGFLRIP
jgi:hypothetical protein